MKLESEETLDLFRGPGVCEWCKKYVRYRESHHLYSRGAGKVDHAWNLAALCQVFSGGDNCHHNHHAGLKPTTADLEDRVAKREGIHPSQIKEFVDYVRRLPKGSILDAYTESARDGQSDAVPEDHHNFEVWEGEGGTVLPPQDRRRGLGKSSLEADEDGWCPL